MKPLAPPKARELLAKLTALAERGVNGEKANAKRKLAALKRRFDFATVNTGGADIFDGVFLRSSVAAPIIRFDSTDFDIANAVKWALESETKIPCVFRGGELLAEAEPQTANRLHDIAGTLTASFAALWRQFAAAPIVNQADRANFVAGLYDGMMDEARTGQQLPKRAEPGKLKRAKRRSVALPAGVSLHPYSVAVKLGRQIRFSAPLESLAGELQATIAGQIEG